MIYDRVVIDYDKITCMHQITARLTLSEYESFENWRQMQNLPESQALCDLVKRFFDGGYQRAPRYRLEKTRKELEEMLRGGI
ncbi:hypothetical protein NIES4073_02320 (plasmid) [Kalymmatonema gypsitolerans NIES-4073]|nr:hypothetical protein NIES4073_02320 [Scytonema sp. NIES-4073]